MRAVKAAVPVKGPGALEMLPRSYLPAAALRALGIPFTFVRPSLLYFGDSAKRSGLSSASGEV